MKRSLKNKLIFCSILVMSMIVSIFFSVNDVKAADLSDGSVSVEYSSIDEYYEIKAPEYQDDAYKFAGWYKNAACTEEYVKSVDKTLDKYYAKFVPEDVLSVKAQNQAGLVDVELLDETTGKIRFVSSVDSTNYKEVGFHVTGKIGTHNLDYDYKENTVYEHLYVVGTNDDKTDELDAEQEFHTASEYFMAHTFRIKFEQFGDEFTVTPYWITLDNIRVDGKSETRSMIDNLEYLTEANLDDQAYYTTLEGAVNAVAAGETAVITVHQEQIVLESVMTITGGKKITITNKDGVNVNIYRTTLTSFYDANNALFLIGTSNSDTTNSLTIGKNSTETGTITIDGRTHTDAANNITTPISDNLKSYFYNYGTLTIRENVTIQYVKGSTGSVVYLKRGTGNLYCDFIKNSTTKGVIAANGATLLNMEGCSLNENYSTASEGGAIFSTGTKVQLLGCQFSSNYSKGNAGAAYIQSYSSDGSYINNCNFEYNKSGKDATGTSFDGGALQLNAMKVNLSGCTFTSNEAPRRGGAIYVSGTSTVGLSDCDFTSNSAPSGQDVCAGGSSNVTYDNYCTFSAELSKAHAIVSASTASITLKTE